MINSVKACLFDGAICKVKNLNYLNDTYIYNIMNRIWLKLYFNQKDGKLPCKRAAHTSAANDNMEMVIYGGSNVSGPIDDKLWILKLGNQNEGIWFEITAIGPRPGPRYGHSLIFMKPFFILFGGVKLKKETNELWILNTKISPCQWEKAKYDNNNVIPCSRVYHSCGICHSGNYSGMMIILGGRDSNQKPLNDIWRLTRYKNRNWSWSKVELKDGYQIKPRFCHSMIFYNELIIILGGKSFYSKSKGNNLLQNEIFNLKTNDGFEFPGISMIRHTNFIHDKNIFLFGGMDINTSNVLGNLYCISLEKLKINSKEFKEFEIIEKDKIPLNQNYFTLDNERKNKKENINNAMTNPVYENNEKHLLNKELEDEKNKNKILIEKINQLEINLKDEKNKNINLSKKLKELNNKLEIMNKNNQKLLKNKENFDNMIYEKEKEIQELKERLSRFPFELNKGEKLMSLVIILID